ncbi:hypothetical protein [Frigoribacterium sp. PhB118]|uniref:hypothetical protein n=1 Tax=Frigoribacterium sp. PhB118 TaxID=2485175 RepID=UPI000F4ABF25|nr:hypothetical protein [Frigoribacterium sp. PhB118]ROS56396.1 SdpI/YhfL family protein [Frigoribacterium sp. PhB118]
MPIVVPFIMLAACAVVFGTTLAAARGRLGVNHLAGIRLQHVMASPEAWQAGHRAALVPITVTCALTAGAAFVPVVVGGLTEGAQGAWVIGSTVVLLIGALVSAGVANRAAGDVLGSS